MRALPFLMLLLSLGHTLPSDAQPRLRLHGSNTIGEHLAPALATAWLQSRGYATVQRREIAFEEVDLHATDGPRDLVVEIRAHGTSTGFTALVADQADIAMASRPASERDAPPGFGQLDSPEQEVVLALDGLAIVVHTANPLRELSVAQLQAVFSGRIRDWKELGGSPGAIALHARDDRSGTYDSFKSLVLRGEPLAATARRYESTTQLAEAVATDRRAIGFVGLSGVHGVRALAIADGGAPVAPSREEVAVEDYPLSRRLYFYLPRELSGAGREFIDFTLSQEGQAVVERAGFVSQNIRAYAGTPRRDAPAEYQSLVGGAQRLSLNFRFGSGRAFLDSKALRDLDRLAQFMLQPGQRQRPLLLLGFSDAGETVPYLAMSLSNERVDYIANRLAERGVGAARSRGLGGAAPVAANDSPQGRQRNRRVEVWIGADPRRTARSASASVPSEAGSP